MKTLVISASLVSISIAVVSCRTTFDGGNGHQRSKVTNISMQAPEKDSNGTIITLEGFSIQVKKDAGDCTFTDIDSTSKITAGKGTITESLKNDCDYSIKLSFGKLSDDGKSMKDVYLTNAEHDLKPAKLIFIKSKELKEAAAKGQKTITVKACVSVTTLGATELKIAASECLAVTDQTSDVNIDVSVGGGPVAPNQISAPTFVDLAATIPDTVKKPLEETKSAMLAGVEAWNKESDATKRHDAACLKLTDAGSKFKAALAIETADSIKVPAPAYIAIFGDIEKSYRKAWNDLNTAFACGATEFGT